MITPPRDNNGRFLKGGHYSVATEIKEGEFFSPSTMIKKGEHISKRTELKKGHKLWQSLTDEKKKEISDKRRGNWFEVTKEQLHQWYIVERMPMNKINLLVGCSNSTIKKYLIRFSIPVRNQSESLMGIKPSENTIRMMRQRKKEWHEKNRGTDKYKEMFKRVSEKHKGKIVSEETRRKCSISFKGRIASLETRMKMSKSASGSKRRLRTPEEKNKIRIDMTNLWKKDGYRKNQLIKIFEGFNIRPNKPESRVMEIIENNKFGFRYVGDGKIWFEGRDSSYNPDFINEGKKLIIEVYGDYWHNRNESKLRDVERIKTYIENGYKCLVIWEKDIKDETLVIKKINNFLGKL